MNMLSTQLKEIKDEKKVQNTSNKQSYEQYQKWTDEFDRLVETGVMRKRGYQLRSISDSPLQLPRINEGIIK
ncbi:MAG: hypothetical protein LBE12_02750 [Planctomycetaceae bacterium]|jgi:hypothetical protein|nr:hypothetical protein [Planctomycetaceae bacterium]